MIYDAGRGHHDFPHYMIQVQSLNTLCRGRLSSALAISRPTATSLGDTRGLGDARSGPVGVEQDEDGPDEVELWPSAEEGRSDGTEGEEGGLGPP